MRLCRARGNGGESRPAGRNRRLGTTHARNLWSEIEGDAFSESQIRRLIVRDGPLYSRPPEYTGAAIGVDIGTEKHHSSVVTLLIDHRNRHIRVAAVENFRPPVRLADVPAGVENIWIRVKRSDEYRRQVVPLLNIGALVKYRQGRGGVLLNNVRVLPSEAVAVNAQKKKTIVATLLRNLGAVFASEKALAAGSNLNYRPIQLGTRCNQYLTASKGWIEGDLDLRHFPVGEVKLAGVNYSIRDFQTSPLPSCIMLAGPGAKGELSDSVRGITPTARRSTCRWSTVAESPIGSRTSRAVCRRRRSVGPRRCHKIRGVRPSSIRCPGQTLGRSSRSVRSTSSTTRVAGMEFRPCWP